MTVALAVIAVRAAQFLLLLAMGMAIIRMLRGPHAEDRVLALDALNINGLLLLLTISVHTGSILYVEAGLVIALLGFVATAAFAKFLARGEVIE